MFLMMSTAVWGQDGSDITYVKPEDLDESAIGKECHIDFGRDSYWGRVIDTLEIMVKTRPIKFYEHRADDGYNNWLTEQYLVAMDHGIETRLVSSKIDSLTTQSIYVQSVLEYYYKGSQIDTITIFEHRYDRQQVARILLMTY